MWLMSTWHFSKACVWSKLSSTRPWGLNDVVAYSRGGLLTKKNRKKQKPLSHDFTFPALIARVCTPECVSAARLLCFGENSHISTEKVPKQRAARTLLGSESSVLCTCHGFDSKGGSSAVLQNQWESMRSIKSARFGSVLAASARTSDTSHS